jgi:signal-transduction protein with cAMP-binding, CBS, and nucleotidyltransferase domain
MHTVEEIMSDGVKTARTTDVIGPLRDLMLQHGIHAVPVLDSEDKLVGIITSADLVEEWAPGMGVLTVMSRNVETVPRHQSVVDAARTMVEKRIHHLVVIERDAVVGLVSSFDMLKHLAGRVQVLDVPSASALRAKIGDILVIRGAHLGDRDRRAVIVGVEGESGSPPFQVRWTDDKDDRVHLYFPGSDAHVESRS